VQGNGQLELDRIRRTFVPKHPPLSLRNRIVVIKRSNSRALTNHDAAIAMLKKDFGGKTFGFLDEPSEVVEFTPRSSMGEEIDYFWSRALAVIAPHGAGLQNIAFVDTGTPVLEICYEGVRGMRCPHMYYMLATNLGLPYYSLVSPGGYTSKITVDIGELRDTTRAMIDSVTRNGGADYREFVAAASDGVTCGLKEVSKT
jgi:hypothetical protein